MLMRPLLGLLHVRGLVSGQRITRAVVSMPIFLALFAVLALAAAPAFAAPEAPEVVVQSPVPAKTATFDGVASPKATEPNEGGTYEFFYKASQTECLGGAHAPESPGIYAGIAHEELPAEPITGLVAGTVYTVCLSVTNVKNEATVSAPVTFTTATPPETPVTLPATGITETSASLRAELNPKAKAAVPVEYLFLYARSPSECTEGAVAPEAPVKTVGNPKEVVSVPVTGLEPSREYAFCVLTINNAGESALGLAVTFKTLPAPPAVEGESVAGVKADEARLEGVLNPHNQVTECKMRYGIDPSLVTGTTVLCEPASFSASFGGQPVGVTVGGLEAKTTYYYRVLAINPTGTSEGAIQSFTTATPPQTPEQVAASEITASTATLHGVLNPGGVAEAGVYKFFYRESATECRGEQENETSPVATLGNKAEQAEASVTGLLPNTTYTFCLDAINQAGEEAISPPEALTTHPAAPSISEEKTSNIGPTTVTVTAMVDAGGSPTAYDIEYATNAQFEANGFKEAPTSPVPGRELPAASKGVLVSLELTGLQPDTVYHYRVAGKNTINTAQGEPLMFETSGSSPPNSVTLPDDRVYELVSNPPNPSEVSSSEVSVPNEPNYLGQDPVTRLPFRAAAGGDALTYVGDPSSEGGDGSEGKGNGNQYQAVRNAGNGRWETSVITPPEGEGIEEVTGEYESFSNNASVGILNSGLPSLANSAAPKGPSPCVVLYAHDLSGFHALFTSTQTPGSKESCGVRNGEVGDEQFAGGNAGTATVPQFSDLLFQTPAPLLPGVLPAAGFPAANLYDSTGGRLSPVNVLPEGSPDPNATFGGPSAGELGQARAIEAKPPDFSNVVSADGSRVFWSSLQAVESGGNIAEWLPAALYVRENPASPGASTVQLDQTEGAGASGGGWFWTASQDGARVLFTDESKLTNDSTAAPGEPDLYEYDFKRPTGERLTDLTVQAGEHTGQHADVKGVIGASEDGSYVYFVAGGSLTAGVIPGSCELAAPNTTGEHEERAGLIPPGAGCNVYVWHEGEPVKWITALAALNNDVELGIDGSNKGGDWRPNLAHRTAEVTPDGQHFVFESSEPPHRLSSDRGPGGVCVLRRDAADSVRVVQPDRRTRGQHSERRRGTSAGQREQHVHVALDLRRRHPGVLQHVPAIGLRG